MDSLIRHKMASAAGGLAAETGSNVTLLRTNVLSNTAVSGGGGIGLWRQATVIARECIISSNEVGSLGGGIHVSDTEPFLFLALTNRLIIGNKASEGAAGIDNMGPAATLMDVTLAENVCLGSSCIGGLDNSQPSSVATIINSILWGNHYADLDGNGFAINHSVVGTATAAISGTGNISQNPLFVDAANGDYHLQAGSPCIDAGTNVGAPPTDFEGDLRAFDGDRDSIATVDMGADEYVRWYYYVPLTPKNY